MPVLGKARAGRYQVTHDHVLLEAFEHIHLAEGRRVGEDAGRLLEGGRRDEALGLERGLGDAKEDRLGLCGLAARLLDPTVVGKECRTVDLLAPEVLAVARIGDPDLAQQTSWTWPIRNS